MPIDGCQKLQEFLRRGLTMTGTAGQQDGDNGTDRRRSDMLNQLFSRVWLW
jgi:hypothetical protein